MKVKIKSSAKRYMLNGYMTLEATFIIPFVFICFILIILYTFYLYNHMVVYQSCYLSALRGSQLKNATNETVKELVDAEIRKLLDNQVYQYQFDFDSDVNLLSIKVNAKSHITNKIAEFNIYKEKELVSNRSTEINRIDPVDYIRNAERF